MKTPDKIKLFAAVVVAGLLGYLGNALIVKSELSKMSQRLAEVEEFRNESAKQVSLVEAERKATASQNDEDRLKIASLEQYRTSAIEKSLDKRVNDLEQNQSKIESMLAPEGNPSLIARIIKLEKTQTDLQSKLAEREEAFVLLYSYVLDFGAATNKVIKNINILSFSPTPDKELNVDLERLAKSVHRIDTKKPKGTKIFP